MIDTVIVSGGDIQSDFALDFLEKKIKENEKIMQFDQKRQI